jgi:hypothetical protein
MFLRMNDAMHARPDWMLCALVLAIALWGAVLDVKSMGDPQTAATPPQLEQVASTAKAD